MAPRLVLALLLGGMAFLGCRHPLPPGPEEDPAAKQGAAPGERGAGDRVVLVFSASQAGQLVPCGCSPDQRGGLPRAAAILKRFRAEDPSLLFIDAGDTLFASTAPPAGPSAAQAELKARALAQGDALLGAAARVLGPRDLARGGPFAASTSAGVPLLDAGGTPVEGARASALLRSGEVAIGLFAAGLGEDPPRTLAARAADLRARGAKVLVLAVQPKGNGALQSARAMLPAARAAGVDLVVLGRRDDPSTDPGRVEASAPPLFAIEGQGQGLLRLVLWVPKRRMPGDPVVLEGPAARGGEDLRELDERIQLARDRAARAPPTMRAQLLQKARELEERRRALAQPKAEARRPSAALLVKAEIVPVDAKAGEDPEAAKLVAAYDAEVTRMNLAAAQTLPAACPRPARGEAAFIGVSGRAPSGESCASCHESEAAFWRRTAHARAYATLVEKQKQFSLDCIRCHVTGWQQPGGVCRIDRTAAGGPGLRATGGVFGEGRRDVQCEMCHGPASRHVADPPAHVRAQVPVSVCVRCHEAENSPHFDDARYRPFIVGPGHGEPLAAGREPRSRGEIESGRAGPNAPPQAK